MENVLQNVSNAAVWGSLFASLILGTFLAIQAVMIREKRFRFSVFAAVCLVIALLDFFHSSFTYLTYEKLRIVVWTLYATTLLWLFGHSRRAIVVTAIALPGAAAIAWNLIDTALATSCVVPPAFLISAWVHTRTYQQTRGFGSCVLAVFSAALGLLCSTYYLFLLSGDTNAIGLGYIHYATLSCCAVLFGWIHVAREMRGKLPVRVEYQHAGWFGGVILTSEVAIIVSLLGLPHWPPISYLAFSLLQLVGVSALFFYYRHQLIIYTDNVTQLLEERTLSLREAQASLAEINNRQAEELARQTRELQAKAEIIDRQRRLELAAQTAGQAAHDIQNLISPMLTSLGQLERSERVEDVRQTATLIRRQADELLDLNGQLLALARRGRREHDSLELRELITDLTPRFPTERLRLELLESVWVKGAWSQISRALSNLIINALDATDQLPVERQTVDIKLTKRMIESVQRCHLGFLNPGEYAVVEVADRGPGVPEDYLERIFEPFFSSKSGHNRSGSGSGLGLSIVSAVMDDHQGVLDLATSSSGTVFTLYLPAIVPEQVSIDLQDIRGNARILLVDDAPSILHQYSRLLEEAGHLVTVASSGDEALRALQLEQFDLLLLDLNMPQRNGYETLFAAIQLRPGIRTVIHSSFVTDEDRIRLGQLGVEYFLQKPASRGEVLRVVKQTSTTLIRQVA